MQAIGGATATQRFYRLMMMLVRRKGENTIGVSDLLDDSNPPGFFTSHFTYGNAYFIRTKRWYMMPHNVSATTAMFSAKGIKFMHFTVPINRVFTFDDASTTPNETYSRLNLYFLNDLDVASNSKVVTAVTARYTFKDI